MRAEKERVPAVGGWFTLDAEQPALLGARCDACGSVAFPPRVVACPNPACTGGALRDVALGRHGRVWSYATNHYPPPAPYVTAEPFEPYTVVAVELADERMVVLGLLAKGSGEVAIGQEVELGLEVLSEDDERQYISWVWRPVS